MRTLIVVLVFAATVVAQEAPQPPFVLDAKKPYVYLEFDHVGQRKPLGEDESNQGLWLKFVNNCRLPVTIRTFDPETGDPGIGVEDEVVPVSGPGGVGPLETITSPISATLVPPGRDTERQPPAPPNQTDTSTESGAVPVSPVVGKQPARPEAAYGPADRPIGYGFEFVTHETVNPGESVLFSVPLEHVSPRWYLRVQFTLVASPPVRGGGEPYSYVDFYWNKLPEKVRSRSK